MNDKIITDELDNLPDRSKVENPGCPEGELGVQTLERMNRVHAPVRELGFRHAGWKRGMKILDLGCGGGATIEEMLKLSWDSRICGLDHSATAVEQTKKRNASYLGTRVQVVQGDVGDLPWEGKSFDLVTAVETVYFWPDMDQAFREIYRVLKPGGKCLVVCESCNPDVGWPDPFHQMTIYLPEELTAFLQKAGFQEIGYERTPDDMLCVWGIRPEQYPEAFSRTELLLGAEAMRRLKKARVAVFGLGGVGGYICEALARSGVGAFDLIDNDTVSITNLNRQIIATHAAVGRRKTEVMRERILSINPEADIRIYNCFFLPENADSFVFEEYDYVADAVDTVTAKIELVLRAKEKGVPVISAMGAGNKLDPGGFRVADLSETRICPLCRVMRKELKKRGVENLKVVYSEEPPLSPSGPLQDLPDANPVRRSTPGSTAFVPAAAGLLMAGEIIRDLIVKGKI